MTITRTEATPPAAMAVYSAFAASAADLANFAASSAAFFAAIAVLRPAVAAAWALFWAAATLAFFASRNACAVVASVALMAVRSGVLIGIAPCLVRIGTLDFFLMGISPGLEKTSGAEPVSEDEYLFFCEEELEELLQKKMEEKQHEQENQEQD